MTAGMFSNTDVTNENELVSVTDVLGRSFGVWDFFRPRAL
jgi:hypothetical protein